MELKGRDSMKVQALPGTHAYQQFLADGITTSKMWGQKYRRFGYDAKVFVLPEDHAYCTAYDNANVFSVVLVADGENIVFASHTTIQQEVNMAKTEALIASFTVDSFKEVKDLRSIPSL